MRTRERQLFTLDILLPSNYRDKSQTQRNVSGMFEVDLASTDIGASYGMYRITQQLAAAKGRNPIHILSSSWSLSRSCLTKTVDASGHQCLGVQSLSFRQI